MRVALYRCRYFGLIESDYCRAHADHDSLARSLFTISLYSRAAEGFAAPE